MVDKIGITGVVGAMILAGTIGGVTVDKIKDKKVTPINEAWGVVLQDSCGNEYHFTDIQYGAVREALFDYYEYNNSVDVCDWGLLASADINVFGIKYEAPAVDAPPPSQESDLIFFN